MTTFCWVDNLSPFLLRADVAGHVVGIRWYGLAYVLGLISAYIAFRLAADKNILRGFAAEQQGCLMVAVCLGVIVGGRLGYMLQNIPELINDPFSFFRIWEGGMAFFGGLAGVIAALAWTAFNERISFWTLTDIASFPAAFGLAVGRLANFANGELWGRPTGYKWGVIFPRVDNVPRHPSQIYEGMSHAVLLYILLACWRRHPNWIRTRPGIYASLFLLGYGVSRLVTDFYRDDDTYWGALSSGQWCSAAIGLLGAGLLFYITSMRPHAIQEAASRLHLKQGLENDI